jgi:hypothetical protein
MCFEIAHLSGRVHSNSAIQSLGDEVHTESSELDSPGNDAIAGSIGSNSGVAVIHLILLNCPFACSAILAPIFRPTEIRMTDRLLRSFIYSLGLLLLMVFPSLAHHSFAAEYDASKPVTLKGVIAKVEWTNPHIRFYMDVKSPGGSTVRWEISGPSVNALARNGGKKDSLKIGETVTVEGFRARKVENLANMKTVKSADGKILLDRIGDQQ